MPRIAILHLQVTLIEDNIGIGVPLEKYCNSGEKYWLLPLTFTTKAKIKVFFKKKRVAVALNLEPEEWKVYILFK